MSVQLHFSVPVNEASQRQLEDLRFAVEANARRIFNNDVAAVVDYQAMLRLIPFDVVQRFADSKV